MVRIISAREISGYEDFVDNGVDGWYASSEPLVIEESKGKHPKQKKVKREESVFIPPVHQKKVYGVSLLRRKH